MCTLVDAFPSCSQYQIAQSFAIARAWRSTAATGSCGAGTRMIGFDRAEGILYIVQMRPSHCGAFYMILESF